jgi:glycerophosphoryl diester phosphodiesterase
MAAFEAAVRLGYRYIETDVHATSDGVLVAFHDDQLERVTDGMGMVDRLPWAAVSRARVAGTEPIPRFDELLEAWPDLRINVEPKHDAAVRPLIDSIRRHAAIERVCVGSFSGSRIAMARAALGPRLCTSMGPRGVIALRLASWGAPRLLAYLRRSGAACVQLPLQVRGVRLVDRGMVSMAHRLGMPFHVWTINDDMEMERLLDLGVDGLMTDRPTALRRVLESRGAWSGEAGTGRGTEGQVASSR